MGDLLFLYKVEMNKHLYFDVNKKEYILLSKYDGNNSKPFVMSVGMTLFFTAIARKLNFLVDIKLITLIIILLVSFFMGVSIQMYSLGRNKNLKMSKLEAEQNQTSSILKLGVKKYRDSFTITLFFIGALILGLFVRNNLIFWLGLILLTMNFGMLMVSWLTFIKSKKRF